MLFVDPELTTISCIGAPREGGKACNQIDWTNHTALKLLSDAPLAFLDTISITVHIHLYFARKAAK